MSKKKHIAIDADYLIFEATEGKVTRTGGFAKEDGEVGAKGYKEPLKPYKDHVKRAIKDIVDEIAINMPGELSGKVRVIFSDPNGNFRYDIYPEYKANRKGGDRSELFYRLRKWVHKKWGYVPNTEADDIVAYYVREKGYVGATFDKDLLQGVPGTWFDVHYMRRYVIHTEVGSAHHFNMIQTLAGDPTDNIKGLPRVAHATAIKLLDKHGWNWDGVVAAYKEKGMSEEDAILTRRLVGMDQWSPKKGVKLWQPKKK